MKYLSCIIVLLVFLTSCGPSEKDIQEAIQKTKTVEAKIMNDAVATEGAHQTATAVNLSAVATLEAYCGKDQVEKAIDSMSDILNRYSDDFTLANNTGRGSLSPIVSQMQQKAQEIEAITVPTCLGKAHAYLVLSMQNGNTAFISFMGQEDDAIVTSHFMNSTTNLKKYTEEIKRIRACAPDCNL
jgi:hypothetical protein